MKMKIKLHSCRWLTKEKGGYSINLSNENYWAKELKCRICGTHYCINNQGEVWVNPNTPSKN